MLVNAVCVRATLWEQEDVACLRAHLATDIEQAGRALIPRSVQDEIRQQRPALHADFAPYFARSKSRPTYSRSLV